MITPEQLNQIESLDIKWPVKHRNSNIEDIDNDIVLMLFADNDSESDEKLYAEFLATCLNALHKDPDRFNQLLNE